MSVLSLLVVALLVVTRSHSTQDLPVSVGRVVRSVMSFVESLVSDGLSRTVHALETDRRAVTLLSGRCHDVAVVLPFLPAVDGQCTTERVVMRQSLPWSGYRTTRFARDH